MVGIVKNRVANKCLILKNLSNSSDKILQRKAKRKLKVSKKRISNSVSLNNMKVIILKEK